MLRASLITLGLLASGGCGTTSSGTGSSMTMDESSAMHENCRKEVVELHAFFEAWFLGEMPSTDAAFERFSSVLAEEFVLVSPGGVARSRTEVLDGVHGGYGSAGVEGAPEMKVFTRAEQARTVGDGLFIVTYEEWQSEGSEERGRISSALMRARPGTPNGVEWVHLHETWLE